MSSGAALKEVSSETLVLSNKSINRQLQQDPSRRLLDPLAGTGDELSYFLQPFKKAFVRLSINEPRIGTGGILYAQSRSRP